MLETVVEVTSQTLTQKLRQGFPLDSIGCSNKQIVDLTDNEELVTDYLCTKSESL